MAISQGALTLPASGSQPSLLVGQNGADSVALVAPNSNSATVYFGVSSAVTSSTGFPLAPGDSLALDGGDLDLDRLYFVGTQNDSVRWLATA